MSLSKRKPNWKIAKRYKSRFHSVTIERINIYSTILKNGKANCRFTAFGDMNEFSKVDSLFQPP